MKKSDLKVGVAFILLLCLSFLKSLGQVNCITLYPDEGKGKDAYLASSEPNRNFGSHPETSGDAWTCAGAPCFGHGLFYFDLSHIPSNRIVTSAYLSLYANPFPVNGNGVAMVGNNESELLRVLNDWDEYFVTWNNAPPTTNQHRVILPASTYSFQDYLNVDVKDIVQDMVTNPSNSYGFMIKLVNEYYYSCMIFASTDFPNASKHPKLEVCYTLATDVASSLNTDYELVVYPNPSNGNLSVEFINEHMHQVSFTMSDVEGRKVFSKSENLLNSGKQTFNFDLTENKIGAGVYIFTLESDGQLVQKKVVIM